jgi:glycosyltransferase involved in cell wall biosynthesis
MELSVAIPTHGRADKLLCCLAGLGRQTFARNRFEVLVGIDGADSGQAGLVRTALDSIGLTGTVVECPKRGPAFVRNRLIERAAAPLLLLLNDDVEPAPDCVSVHVEEQRRLQHGSAMVLGDAPWKINEPDRLFDRLVRETSMIFFYDRMREDPAPDRDWGFRHAWTLNLSLPKRLVTDAGWFNESLPSARFEDIELAWRICSRGAKVVYRPAARVLHDHRYEARQYLEREYMLGYDAWSLALASPACARAIFGRDIGSNSEIAYAREFVERERMTASGLEHGFWSLAEMPSDLAEGPHASTLVKLCYQQHLLLKRFVWRQGLIAAAEGAHAKYVPLINRCGSEGGHDRLTSAAWRGPTPPQTASRP